MIQLYIIILILFNHWIFDFFLQTREMANNKSKSNYHLAEHVMIYALGLLLISPILFPMSIVFALIWIAVNAVAHFFTDYVTSRATSALYEQKRYQDFFNVNGIDQMIHYITLFGTYVWLKN